jgi:hypothetical protein
VASAWLVTGSLATLLLILLVGVMQRRGYFAVYPILFLYIITSLLASVAEWTIILKFYSLSNEDYRTYYWTNEFILQTFLFVLMLAFIYRAWERNPNRLVLTLGIAFIALAGAFGSIFFAGDNDPKKLYSLLSRNLSFASALLNFLLWTVLIKNRGRDFQLLLLAAGVGLMTAGKAVGQSLRTIGPEFLTAGNVAIVASQLLSYGIWLWTLRSVPARDHSGKLVAVGTARDTAS